MGVELAQFGVSQRSGLLATELYCLLYCDLVTIPTNFYVDL
jgi:hypothetical protein